MKSGFIRQHFNPKRIALRIMLAVIGLFVAVAIVTLTFPPPVEEAVNFYRGSTFSLVLGIVILVICAEELILREERS